MMERSPLQYLSKTFTHSSKVTLPNIRKGLVKVTFPSHLQYLNGSLSKSLRSLKVYFRAVIYTQFNTIHLPLSTLLAQRKYPTIRLCDLVGTGGTLTYGCFSDLVEKGGSLDLVGDSSDLSRSQLTTGGNNHFSKVD